MKPTNIKIGTGAFAYKEWKGKFYPKDLPESEAVSYYAQLFSAVELNNTFYKMDSVRSSQKWMKQGPPSLLFAIKVPQTITHFKRLKNCGGLVKKFFKYAAGYKSQLGPINFQLPPNFKKDLPRLEAFLKWLPKEFPLAFEFRHPTWFEPDVFQILKKYKICLVYNDTDIKMPFVSTADWGYIRLRRLKYSDVELKKWMETIKSQKWKQALVIFKHEEKVTAPKLAERFKALIS